MSNDDTLIATSADLRLYTIAHDDAARIVGKDVFAFMPDVVKKALVAQAIVTLVSAQDESISDARFRHLTLALNELNEEQY